MPAKKGARGFTDDERAAMRERAKELRARSRPGQNGEQEVLAKIAAMPQEDRALGERLHTIIKGAAPDLVPRTWYGMPAYSREGQIVCWYQNAGKFKARYGTLGFSDEAHLDEGHMWPVTYALTELSSADEARIAALVKKAVS